MELRVVDFAKCSIEHENVSEEDLKATGKAIYEGFAELGILYLKNTGISEAEVTALMSLSKRFLSLDRQTKRQYTLDASHQTGYIGIGDENLTPYKPGDYKELYDTSGTGFVSKTTKWPDSEVEDFSKTTKDFMKKTRLLAIRIFDALSTVMDLKDKDFFRKSHSRLNDKRNWTALRTLYYPVVPQDYNPKEDEMRVGEHSDWGTFTILFQDNVGGLQIKRHDGSYVEAIPIPGTALVNVADALQFWTGDGLKSARHRILLPDPAGPKNVGRSSIAYFVFPDDEVLMSGIVDGPSSNAKEQKQQQEEHEGLETFLDFVKKYYRDASQPVPPED